MGAADALVIRGGAVLTASGWREACDVRVEAGRIAALDASLSADGARILDAQGQLVVPGWIDVHIHGASGATFEDGALDGVQAITVAVARHGTTGLLATVAALPPDALRRAVAAIATAAKREGQGARLLGIHLEGPYLNPARAGAQRPDWMRPPSLDELDALQGLCGGMIRLITVAPELPGAIAFIAALRGRGIAVALGHSLADADTIAAAVDAGATHVTHLFNAMEPLHQRAPGLVGSALVEDRLSVELICDGVHVQREVVDVALRCKPADKVALVSDAVAACAIPTGELALLGTVCVATDAVRVKATGQLAGSCLTLDAALRRLRTWFPARPIEQLLAMASSVPAHLIGQADRFGTIAPGFNADMVVVTPQLDVVASICGGRLQ